jgi:hypothetical protein
VVVDRPGAQVVLGHAEALLDAPELVVGADHELRARVGDVGDVALPAGQRAGLSAARSAGVSRSCRCRSGSSPIAPP